MKLLCWYREAICVCLFAYIASFTLLGHAQEVEEIVVQAEQSENDTVDDLVSATVLSGEKLADAGIENVEDVAAYVPNLVLTETDTGTNIVVRGIGAGVNQGFDQSVGLYVDNVPLPRSQMARAPFLDLENLSVLRGPQYVLDGSYSIAGSVHMFTQKATDDFTAGFDFNYIPSQSDRKLLMTAGIPIGNRAGIRFAVQQQTSDGYIENVTRNEDGPQRDQTLFRVVGGWDPTDSLSLKLKLEHGEFDTRGRQIEIILDDPTPFANSRRGPRPTDQSLWVLTRFHDDTHYAYRTKRTFYDIGDRISAVNASGDPAPQNLEFLDFYFSGLGYTDRLYQNYIDGLPGNIANPDDTIPNYGLGDIPAGLRDTTLDFRRGADADEFSNNTSQNITLNLDYSMGDASINVTTSYIDYDVEELIDSDFTAAPLFTTPQQEQYTQTFHQIEFSSPKDEFIELTLGASYLDGDLEYSDRTIPTLETAPSGSLADLQAFRSLSELSDRAGVLNPNFPLALYLGRFSRSGETIVSSLETLSPDRIFTQSNQITAAYFQSKFNWTDTFRTTFGLRYTHSRKKAIRDVALTLPNGDFLDFSDTSQDLDALTSIFQLTATFWGTIYGVQSTTDRYEDIPPYVSGGTQRGGPLNDTTVLAVDALKGDRREEKLLPSLTAEWDITPDLSISASVRKANKLGGFDARGNASPEGVENLAVFPGTFEFEDEDAISYEIGAKWYLPNGWGQVFATAFFTEFKDLQVSRSDGRVGFAVDNAGVAEMRGIEIEGQLLPTEAFSINYSLAWIDFEFQEFLKGTCALDEIPDHFINTVPRLTVFPLDSVIPIAYTPAQGLREIENSSFGAAPWLGAFETNASDFVQAREFTDAKFINPAFCDFAGRTNQYVADWQSTVTFNYTMELPSLYMQFKPALDVIYNSGYHTTVSQEEDVAQGEYTQFNGRLALVHPDGIWEAAVTGENLTNEKIVTFAGEMPLGARIQGANSFYGFIRPPRSIGLNFRYNIF